MKAAKIVAALMILLGAIASIREYCVRPYLCNLATKSVMTMTQRLSSRSEFSVRVGARDNLRMLQACWKCSSTNIAYLMVKAANEGALQDYAAAESTYQHALAFDRRPELYLNLGLAQLNRGQTTEATHSLLTSCRFNLDMINDVPEPERTVVHAIIARERADNEARLLRLHQR